MTTISENRYKMSRNNASMTQEQAAEALYISTRTLSDYENNHARPPDDVVLAMVKLYNCQILGWWHLKQSPLGDYVLPDITMPETNGDMALQAWSAQNELVPVVNSLMELLSGRMRVEDFCEVAIEQLKAKISILEQIRGRIASIVFYGRKIVSQHLFPQKKQAVQDWQSRQTA